MQWYLIFFISSPFTSFYMLKNAKNFCFHRCYKQLLRFTRNMVCNTFRFRFFFDNFIKPKILAKCCVLMCSNTNVHSTCVLWNPSHWFFYDNGIIKHRISYLIKVYFFMSYWVFIFMLCLPCSTCYILLLHWFWFFSSKRFFYPKVTV